MSVRDKLKISKANYTKMNTWGLHHSLNKARLRSAVVWAWVWAFMWAWSVCGVTGSCPKVCECKWKDGKETVSCPDAEFIDIPRFLDPSTQVLNLKNNNLQILPRDSFADAGLVNLQKVWLNYCNLKFLENDAFNMLANLVELDLSHNSIQDVPSEALGDVSGLRDLRLAHNKISTLPAAAFTPTPDLVRLDISHNLIDVVNNRAFRGLTRLEVLKLSGNKLKELFSKTVQPLVAIHELHLEGNPWHCDCKLRPLRQWMMERNVAFSEPPSCTGPDRLRSRSWQSLLLNEYVCTPSIIAVAPSVLAAHGENVSLSCRVETDVDVAVTWFMDNRPIRNASETRYRVLDSVSPNNEMRLSNLTIASVAPQDQGTYSCLAYNKAGRVETNLTLQVSDEIAQPRLVTMDRVFVTGGLLSAMAMILIVLLLLIAIILRRRQQTRRRRGQEGDHKNETPQLAQAHGSSSSDSHPKLAEYQIVPTNDLDNSSPMQPHSDKSWMIRDSSVDDFPASKDIEKPNSYADSDKRKLNKPRPSGNTISTSPSTVSYVEIPKSEIPTVDDRLRWKDQSNDSKDSLLRHTNSQMGSQLSMGSGGPYPDLLDLPYTQQNQQKQSRNSMQPLNAAYCTLPRSSNSHISSGTAAPPSTSGGAGATSLQENSFSLPATQRYRCASWVDLADAPSSSTPYGRTPSSRPQISLLDAAPDIAAHHATLQELLAAHRAELGGDGGAVGGSPDPCSLEYHAAQLEKFLLEYRSLQEQLYRMKESYEASQKKDRSDEEESPVELNEDDRDKNVPPPCPETPNSQRRFNQVPINTNTRDTKGETSPEDLLACTEPLRSILKKRYEEGTRGLPVLQGLLGLQGLHGLHGLKGLQSLQGVQELQKLQGFYSKGAYVNEEQQTDRLRPNFTLPHHKTFQDHES